MSETETQNKNHVYQDYGANDNVYAEYELSEEDQILRELNARYNQAYTGRRRPQRLGVRNFSFKSWYSSPLLTKCENVDEDYDVRDADKDQNENVQTPKR